MLSECHPTSLEVATLSLFPLQMNVGRDLGSGYEATTGAALTVLEGEGLSELAVEETH